MEQPLNIESIDSSAMAELFNAVGFEVSDEDSYNLLVECIEVNGQRTRIYRGEAVLHGRCWKLGAGLEVWSVLYEQGNQLYYADCRPAFRSRYFQAVVPWELIEYDEDGEAIVRGCLDEGEDVVFELQNLTELDPAVFRESHLHVALAGLAYSARVHAPLEIKSKPDFPQCCFKPADEVSELAEEACENDYLITGHILAWKDIENNATGEQVVWIYVDARKIRLEILVNRSALEGRLRIGAMISANIWLQGHILEEEDISARYEGVDREYEMGDFWARLRRDN